MSLRVAVFQKNKVAYSIYIHPSYNTFSTSSSITHKYQSWSLDTFNTLSQPISSLVLFFGIDEIQERKAKQTRNCAIGRDTHTLYTLARTWCRVALSQYRNSPSGGGLTTSIYTSITPTSYYHLTTRPTCIDPLLRILYYNLNTPLSSFPSLPSE